MDTIKLIEAARTKTLEILTAVQKCKPNNYVAMLGNGPVLEELPAGFKPSSDYLAFGCGSTSLRQVEETIEWYARWS